MRTDVTAIDVKRPEANIPLVVIQRVKSASVTVDSELISSIGKGLLVFAGVGKDDTEKEAENLVNKVLKAKFWPDENGAQVRT